MGEVLERIAQGNNRIKTAINPGEGAFYGPKFEYVLRDPSAATGSAAPRRWTSTCRNALVRFISTPMDEEDAGDGAPCYLRLDGAFYRHPDRTLCRPLPALARAGAGGRHHDHLGRRRVRRAGAGRRAARGLRAEIDLRNEKINYKVREHSLAKIPALLVVGKKEAEQQTVSIRRLGSDKQQVVPLTEAIAALVDEATPPDVKRANAAG